MTPEEAIAAATEAVRKQGIDPSRARELAKALHALHDEMEVAAGTEPPAEARKGAQSKQFMIQLLPYIQNFMRGKPKGTKFTALDVGPGTSHGSNLLASLYQTMELGYRLHVSTLDIRANYAAYVRLFCRYVSPLYGDIYKHDRTYDIVIASHVVEHVREPASFCHRLQELSTGIVIVCAPYREERARLTKGHVNVFDDGFFRTIGAETVDTLPSPAWGAFLDPPYKMFVATLPGLAHAQHSASLTTTVSDAEA